MTGQIWKEGALHLFRGEKTTGSLSNERCRLLEEPGPNICDASLPTQLKGAFGSPVNKISRLALGDTLFQKLDGIDILYFLAGRSSSCAGGVTEAFGPQG